jgi:LacI family transcriptional regulator
MSTIKDVAKKTGLSLSTISKYLNGGHVREENRQAIEQAVAELDYSVNYFARSLKSARSRTVGILLPTISSPFFGRVVAAMDPVFQEAGYESVVCSYNFNRELELQKLEFLAHKHVDGLIYVPESATMDEIAARVSGTPLIMLDRTVPGASCDRIVVDNLNAVYMAVEHLIGRGHRRIGLICGPMRISTALERATGYRRVLADYSLPVDESLIRSGNYDVESGYRLFGELLDLPDPPTALCVTSYDMTIGAITAAHERGVALPADVDFIGYDNIDLCSVVNPPLEIIEQPMEAMGAEAAKLILARVSGDDSPSRLLRLKAKIAKQGAAPIRKTPAARP